MITNKNKLIHAGKVLLAVTAISILFSCSPQDPAEIAGQVARDWTANNINVISTSIAGQVVSNNPLLQSTIALVISNEVKQRISWEYSHPDKLAENKYRVVATASTLIEIPLLGNYKVSVNYNLVIDTKEKRVLSADMDAGSFAMTKQ